MTETLRDVKVAGSCNINGGSYRDVNISGSAKVDGDITSTCLTVSGSARISGNVTTGECRISGSGRIEGSLTADSTHASGSMHVDGDLSAQNEVKISGSGQVGGALKGQTVKSSGSLRVGKGIECETLSLSGSFTVKGLINAGTMEVWLAGESHADEIGGETIAIRRGPGTSFNLFGLSFSLGIHVGGLTATTIEASTIHLEYTRAQVVRGGEVEIGEGCEIDRVEYSGSISVADGSIVKEQVKID